ncbi:MAG: DUF4406 domain-containing protein [Acidobacteriota bacterium]
MLIAVAGPYSAPTEAERQRNLDRMNQAAAELLARGHVPVIGVNAALPVVARLPPSERYEAIMTISLAVVDRCDGLLLLGESPGANRERDLVLGKGLPVWTRLADVPPAGPAESRSR